MTESLAVVTAAAVLALLAGWGYFRRYQVFRPPIGVFNIRDVGLFIGGIILIPYIYMIAPTWLVMAMLTLVTLGPVYIALEPALPTRWLTWLVIVPLLGTDIALAVVVGTNSGAFLALNNLVLIIAVVGVTNLWAQSGLSGRDVTIMAGVLCVYDVLATSVFGLMGDLFARLIGLPFMPLIGWAAGAGLGLGLGDLLLATTFPLVMRKAYGKRAGLVALGVDIAGVAGMLAAVELRLFGQILPVMTVLGPLMIAQYTYWRRRGPERRTWRYLAAEPVAVPR